MTIEYYSKILVEMVRNNKTKNPERNVFLNIDGTPNEQAYEIGIKLNELGGLEAMQQAGRAVLNMPDRIRGDAEELEICWDGIGKWKA